MQLEAVVWVLREHGQALSLSVSSTLLPSLCFKYASPHHSTARSHGTPSSTISSHYHFLLSPITPPYPSLIAACLCY